MCVIWQKGMLGASIFSTGAMKLQLMQDIPESNNFMLTKQCKSYITILFSDIVTRGVDLVIVLIERKIPSTIFCFSVHTSIS